jgi:hypothetical protein
MLEKGRKWSKTSLSLKRNDKNFEGIKSVHLLEKHTYIKLLSGAFNKGKSRKNEIIERVTELLL